jgi:hypothetical protein
MKKPVNTAFYGLLIIFGRRSSGEGGIQTHEENK